MPTNERKFWECTKLLDNMPLNEAIFTQLVRMWCKGNFLGLLFYFPAEMLLPIDTREVIISEDDPRDWE